MRMIFCFIVLFLSGVANANLRSEVGENESTELVAVVVYDLATEQAVCQILPSSNPEILPRDVPAISVVSPGVLLPDCEPGVVNYLSKNVRTLAATRVAGSLKNISGCISSFVIGGLGAATNDLLGPHMGGLPVDPSAALLFGSIIVQRELTRTNITCTGVGFGVFYYLLH